MSTTLSSSRTLRAPVDAVWEVLADAGQHHRFDDTGMVGPLVGPAPSAVGDVFRMDMTWRDDEHTERYRSDNHVTVWERPTVLAWATALPDGAPLGWTWTYRLESLGNETSVTLTYDWTGTPDAVARRFGVPIADEHGLARSLELLAAVVEAPERSRPTP